LSEHRPFALAGARPQYGPDKFVDVLHIDLYLRPDLDAKVLYGVCTTTVEAIEDGVRSIRFDAIDLKIEDVSRDGVPLAHRSSSSPLPVEFGRPLPARDRPGVAAAYRPQQPPPGT